MESFVPNEKRKVHYFFSAMHSLKRYPVESQRALATGVHRDTAHGWCWYYLEKIQQFETKNITWPDHNYGENI